ncbi:tachykinin-3a isoform X2 [Cyprinodon tularosa]|uniref:Tachykinin-3-like n=1 Tax=Cyprinodon variegatus TaxID=28743 RepID=A0A3Q2DJ80_CYPVA|nr:PREDICTED: tachykinin-3-like isoform X2 [Cyprinodon variegatus]XP_038139085.1 tachykinin-3a isoform X2 [Cyprinodon tularosa]
MRRSLLLVTLFLIMKLRSSHSRCEETGARRSSSDTTRLEDIKRNILRRYTDLDYDSFVGLMGKRNAEEDVESQQKREMDDLFVGLMGRRSSDSDSPWRREYPERRGILLNKSRLRLLQGL